MEIIKKYFPNLSSDQENKFSHMGELYKDWNGKINVISRKDIDNFYERHVLHSLAIAKFLKFTPGTEIMDLGTGGGFPALPLAILFPEVSFHAIDGTAKKIKVLETISKEIEVNNLHAEQLRAEENKRKYDFVVTRAVATMDKLIPWSERLIKRNKQQNAMPNGMIALKGGLIKKELQTIKKYTELEKLSDYFQEEFFDTKYLVYTQLS